MLRTSPTGSRGFTLLELMLVILILGLMIGLVSFSIPDRNGAQLDTEARRITALIALARELAIYQNRDMGLLLEKTGYRFLYYHNGRWQPPDGQPRLQPRQLPEGLSFVLSVEQQPVALSPLDETVLPEPQVRFLSDGQQSEFQLTLIDRQRQAHRALEGAFSGALHLSEASP